MKDKGRITAAIEEVVFNNTGFFENPIYKYFFICAITASLLEGL